MVRKPTTADQLQLQEFRCARPERPWTAEVEEFSRGTLCTWVLDPHAEAWDPRMVILAEASAGTLLGVAAHERATITYEGRAEIMRHIQVIALEAWVQGASDAHGRRLSDLLLSATLEDIADADDPSQRPYATVHKQNVASLSMFERAHMVPKFDHPDSANYHVVA